MSVFRLPLIMTTVRVVQFIMTTVRVVQFAFFVWLFTALANEEWPTVVVCLFGLFVIEIGGLLVIRSVARAAGSERRKTGP